MITIPKGKEVIKGINSFFLDIEKFCEYYHENIAPCAIHFKAPSCEAILYYDESDLIGGGISDNNSQTINTNSVIDNLKTNSAIENFDVTVYEVDINDIYYWSSLFHAKSKYDGLNSEFTDLTALIKKMKSEALSGYIEVIFNDTPGGIIFFLNGMVVRSQYFLPDKPPEGLPGKDIDLAALLYFSKKKSGIFNVKETIICQPSTQTQEANGDLSMNVGRVCTILELVLNALNKVVSKKQSRGYDFNLMLKKKFIEKAGEYDFLDPFANEFQYKGSKVAYQGSTDIQTVAKAILKTSQELAAEQGCANLFDAELNGLKKNYAKEFKNLSNGA